MVLAIINRILPEIMPANPLVETCTLWDSLTLRQNNVIGFGCAVGPIVLSLRKMPFKQCFVDMRLVLTPLKGIQ
jgi:hypothetical protein